MILSSAYPDIWIILYRRLDRWVYEPSPRHLRALATRYGKFFNRSKITSTDSPTPFQPSIPSYYPHLPILLFTQNLTSFKNLTKLILLTNGFFEHEQWGLNAMDHSSAAISNLNIFLPLHRPSILFLPSDTTLLSISLRLL